MKHPPWVLSMCTENVTPSNTISSWNTASISKFSEYEKCFHFDRISSFSWDQFGYLNAIMKGRRIRKKNTCKVFCLFLFLFVVTQDSHSKFQDLFSIPAIWKLSILYAFRPLKWKKVCYSNSQCYNLQLVLKVHKIFVDIMWTRLS